MNHHSVTLTPLARAPSSCYLRWSNLDRHGSTEAEVGRVSDDVCHYGEGGDCGLPH